MDEKKVDHRTRCTLTKKDCGNGKNEKGRAAGGRKGVILRAAVRRVLYTCAQEEEQGCVHVFVCHLVI